MSTYRTGSKTSLSMAVLLLAACDGSGGLGAGETRMGEDGGGNGRVEQQDASTALPELDAEVDPGPPFDAQAPMDAEAPMEAQAVDADVSSDDDASADAARVDAAQEDPDGGDHGDATVLADAATDAAGEQDGASEDAGADAGSEDALDCFTLRAFAYGSSDPFKVGTATDKYVDFGFATGLDGDAYVARITPLIESVAVQEVLIFSSESAVPGKVSLSPGARPSGQLLYVWAPGGNALDFATFGRDAALALPAGMNIVMQIHYRSSDSSAVDDSGVRICTRAQEPAEIATISWLGNDAIVGSQTRGTCDPATNTTINVLGYMPRMRSQGEAITAVINEADETSTDFFTAPFSHSSQRWLAHSARVDAGDTITVRCTYKKQVAFGPASSNELCYLFVVATPGGALTNGDQALYSNACLGSLVEGIAAGNGL